MTISKGLILLSTLVVAGCVSTSNDGIPCEDYDDQTCPTGYWCKSALLNNTRWVCVSEESVPRPELEFVGIGFEAAGGDQPDSAFADSISITEEFNTVRIRVRNVGGNTARIGGDIVLESECCLGADSFSRISQSTRLKPGESFDIDYRFARGTDDCPSQQQVTIEVFEKEVGATYFGTFDVDFTPPTDRSRGAVGCD